MKLSRILLATCMFAPLTVFRMWAQEPHRFAKTISVKGFQSSAQCFGRYRPDIEAGEVVARFRFARRAGLLIK